MKSYTDIQFLKPNIGHFPALSGYVLNGFSWGPCPKNMSFKFGNHEEVEDNINGFFLDLAVEHYQEAVHLGVEHGSKIVLVTEDNIEAFRDPEGFYEVEGDTIFTQISGQVIYLKPGDCMSAVVFAPVSNDKSIIGLIHAGWRGADAGVFMKSLTYLKDELNVNLQMVHLGFVPHLKVENLLLKSIDQLTRPDFHFAKGYLNKIGDIYMFDQAQCVIDECLFSGISGDNIEFYDVDTYTEAEKGNTFSHRYYAINEQRVPELREGRFILAVRNSPTR